MITWPIILYSKLYTKLLADVPYIYNTGKRKTKKNCKIDSNSKQSKKKYYV